MLKKLIKAAGFKTQQELADKMGVTQKTVSGWCCGKRPALEKMLLLQKLVGLPIEYWDKNNQGKNDDNI